MARHFRLSGANGGTLRLRRPRTPILHIVIYCVHDYLVVSMLCMRGIAHGSSPINIWCYNAAYSARRRGCRRPLSPHDKRATPPAASPAARGSRGPGPARPGRPSSCGAGGTRRGGGSARAARGRAATIAARGRGRSGEQRWREAKVGAAARGPSAGGVMGIRNQSAGPSRVVGRVAPGWPRRARGRPPRPARARRARQLDGAIV